MTEQQPIFKFAQGIRLWQIYALCPFAALWLMFLAWVFSLTDHELFAVGCISAFVGAGLIVPFLFESGVGMKGRSR